MQNPCDPESADGKRRVNHYLLPIINRWKRCRPLAKTCFESRIQLRGDRWFTAKNLLIHRRVPRDSVLSTAGWSWFVAVYVGGCPACTGACLRGARADFRRLGQEHVSNVTVGLWQYSMSMQPLQRCLDSVARTGVYPYVFKRDVLSER